ncbi:uncharacterized protein LOC132720734 [Ruditapes philippinarum]|uniref:uncharacterized protein LOC132720734 n=1 Tax=Ruditapes philippinarum TaxID=129788 RepID=UPI00295BC123|nr:uncharacterized protein LOC132720734 [Ruditapes philippinarum]
MSFSTQDQIFLFFMILIELCQDNSQTEARSNYGYPFESMTTEQWQSTTEVSPNGSTNWEGFLGLLVLIALGVGIWWCCCKSQSRKQPGIVFTPVNTVGRYPPVPGNSVIYGMQGQQNFPTAINHIEMPGRQNYTTQMSYAENQGRQNFNTPFIKVDIPSQINCPVSNNDIKTQVRNKDVQIPYQKKEVEIQVQNNTVDLHSRDNEFDRRNDKEIPGRRKVLAQNIDGEIQGRHKVSTQYSDGEIPGRHKRSKQVEIEMSEL